MPIAEMEKIAIVGLVSDREEILDLLQRSAAVQVEDATFEDQTPSEITDYSALLSELEFAINFLGRIGGIKPGFLESLAPAKERISYARLKRGLTETDFEGLIKKCRGLERELGNIADLKKKLIRERELLRPWLPFDLPLSQLKGTERVKFLTGTLPSKQVEDLSARVKGQPLEIQTVKGDGLVTPVVVAVATDFKEEALKVLAEVGFLEVKLPLFPHTVEEELEGIKEALKDVEQRYATLFNEVARLARKRFSLMCVHDFFLQKRVAGTTSQKMGVTKYTFMVKGWVKRRELSRLEERLSSRFPEITVVVLKKKPDEVPPVAIENSGILKPFEAVTGIYGLPGYREVDPTPLLAVFFITFFGLCLGDAGYGITLALVSLYFYKKAGPTSPARKLLMLLVFGGVITTIAGALTGGWFGVEPVNFPAFLDPVRRFLLGIRIIDPVGNPIGMLLVALGFGLVQIFFGILVNLYVKWRDKRFIDAILDDLLWIYFLSALLTWGLQAAGVVAVGKMAVWLVIGGAVALVLTQGRKQKNIFLKIGVGILSLYKTIGYLSDTLSYSRILALGLATSIIAMVINMIALMTKDSVPVVGYVIMALILVFGHMFNIAVNVLGSFIHSGRLQFVEFFSKFLEGGGREFRPFKRDGKFVEIES